jgi:hypothetical protein
MAEPRAGFSVWLLGALLTLAVGGLGWWVQTLDGQLQTVVVRVEQSGGPPHHDPTPTGVATPRLRCWWEREAR